MKFTEVGTTLKHPETIYDNVKNLSKKIISLDKGALIISFDFEELFFVSKLKPQLLVSKTLHNVDKFAEICVFSLKKLKINSFKCVI
jgi:hypothetical protein